MNPYIIQNGVIAFTMAITALGVGIGQGLTGNATQEALNRQPAARSEIARSNLLALALIETAALLVLLISLLLLFKKTVNLYGALAQLGIAFALGIPGLLIGIVSAMPAQAAAISISRQPFFAKKIVNLMLLTQSLLQTPLVFGFIVALLIYNKIDTVQTLSDAARCIGAGLCIGLGSIGPAIGVGRFTHTACKSIGVNPAGYKSIFTFTIMSQAIIETPIIFASIISFWLVTAPPAIPSILYFAAAFVMAVGTFSPGLASSKTAEAACEQIAHNPALIGMLSRTSLVIQAFIDTSAVYAFIIALFILITYS